MSKAEAVIDQLLVLALIGALVWIWLTGGSR